MKSIVTRVAAVHDMSCFGRCSLAVIIPVLSCMGIQVCPLPTAVLSSHLGGFSNLAFYDFTAHMPEFFQHWKREGIAFDCIYSGFLASEAQIDVLHAFIDDFSGNAPLIVVDPVMGDEGKLYSTYTPSMQEKMKTLVQRANIITPNYTEACFLLGESYWEKANDITTIQQWLRRLAEFGPEIVVMTGIPFEEDQIITMAYEAKKDVFWEVRSEYIPAHYPGTGDVFASVLLGGMLKGMSLPDAIHKAVTFVEIAIKATYHENAPKREGVLLESVLPWLCQEMNSDCITLPLDFDLTAKE